MYTIGEISNICSVTTKALRYYDEIGLLHPAYVDKESRYRYYSREQVYQLLFISELKSYDLKLEQIKAVMESKDGELLEHFLAERISQLDEIAQKSMEQKSIIEKKIQNIRSGGNMMSERMELKVTEVMMEPIKVMYRRVTIDITTLGSVIGSIFEAIYRNGLRPKEGVMNFYFDKEFQPENANLEVCVPIEDSKNEINCEDIKIIEPGKCAVCDFTGPYNRLGEAYAAVAQWIEDNGYEVVSAPFDYYLNSPEQVKHPDDLRTKVCFPIKKK